MVGAPFPAITLMPPISRPRLNTIAGPLLGAALIVPFENFLRAELADALPGMNLAILGLLMVLAALFMKRGVVGAFEDLMRKIKGKKGDH